MRYFSWDDRCNGFVPSQLKFYRVVLSAKLFSESGRVKGIRYCRGVSSLSSHMQFPPPTTWIRSFIAFGLFSSDMVQYFHLPLTTLYWILRPPRWRPLCPSSPPIGINKTFGSGIASALNPYLVFLHAILHSCFTFCSIRGSPYTTCLCMHTYFLSPMNFLL